GGSGATRSQIQPTSSSWEEGCAPLPLRRYHQSWNNRSVLALSYQTGRKRSHPASYQLLAHARTPAFGVAPKGGLPDRTRYRPIKTHRAATVGPQEKARAGESHGSLCAVLIGNCPY